MEVRKKKDWDKKKKTLSGILSPVRQIPSMIKHWGTKRIRAVRFHLGKRQPWRTKKASAAKAEVFIERREVAAAVIETTAKSQR